MEARAELIVGANEPDGGEGVAFTLGPPGKGGISWDDQGMTISGQDGVAVEMRRFPE
ncbi:hypothetical protein [Sorangium sp. So ce388]|uniref:hypothetical protein n=1 Tax=Sorangium sp. So ce388 TaxID=3133309 RepID=UPI003F5C0743